MNVSSNSLILDSEENRMKSQTKALLGTVEQKVEGTVVTIWAFY